MSTSILAFALATMSCFVYVYYLIDRLQCQVKGLQADQEAFSNDKKFAYLTTWLEQMQDSNRNERLLRDHFLGRVLSVENKLEDIEKPKPKGKAGRPKKVKSGEDSNS